MNGDKNPEIMDLISGALEEKAKERDKPEEDQ
jgi:hypothetical protein